MRRDPSKYELLGSLCCGRRRALAAWWTSRYSPPPCPGDPVGLGRGSEEEGPLPPCGPAGTTGSGPMTAGSAPPPRLDGLPAGSCPLPVRSFVAAIHCGAVVSDPRSGDCPPYVRTAAERALQGGVDVDLAFPRFLSWERFRISILTPERGRRNRWWPPGAKTVAGSACRNSAQIGRCSRVGKMASGWSKRDSLVGRGLRACNAV